jgi:hypothetical protein
MSERKWTERLQYLANLEEGWLDGYGVPSRPEATQAVESLLSAVFPDDSEYSLKQPGIFPIEEGGINLEWFVGNRIISIEVMGDYDETYSLFYMNVENQYVIEVNSDEIDVIVSKLKETVLFSASASLTLP